MFQNLKESLRGGQLLQGETTAVESSQHFSQRAKLSCAFVCLFAMIVLCILPFQFAHASYNNCTTIDGVEYTWYKVDASGQLDATNGQFACVEYITGTTQSAIKVPSTIGGLPVTRFGEDGKTMTLTNVSSIDLSSCSNLEYVYISNATSQINSLNVANCSKLKTLNCQNVSLTSLNVSGCSALTHLWCSNNNLTTLNVSGCSALIYLNCSSNKLSSLNVSGCSALDELSCSHNSLTSLNISGCSMLDDLDCSSNNIASLDVSGCKVLKRLDCSHNKVTSLDISACYSLYYLYCDYNNISNTSQLESWLAQHDGTVLPQNGSGGSSTDPGTSKVNIANCTVSVIADQKYTGKALTPKPTVKNGNTTLKEGTDYTLTYKNNVNAGTATITITGKNSYTGSKTVTFKITVAAGWVKGSKGWSYKNSDGTYSKNCSQVIAGKTYRFDAAGWMRTGWVKDGSYWYYHDKSGAMQTGWKKSGGKWYYLDPTNGSMKTSFFNVGSSRYYADGSGVMQTGWKKISNNWYYFKSSGAMAKGWTKVSGKWYFLDKSTGIMKSGWFTEGGKTYYLDPKNGDMKTGWKKVTDTWYCFKSSGEIVKGWMKSGGKWYYLDENGQMITEKYQVNGKTYYLSGNGAMKTGWIKDGNDWFYYSKSGVMATDTWVGNYWLNSDGVMATNAWVDNQRYFVNAVGLYAGKTKAKTPASIADGFYCVKSSLGGSAALDISAASMSLGGNAQVWTANNSGAQVWKFTNMGNGYYRISNGNSNLVLDVDCGKSADGTNVRQWEWNGSGAQLWKIYKSNFGGYVFVNKATGKALDVSAASNKPGTNVHIWTENNTKAQSWTLEKKASFSQSAVTDLGGKSFEFKTNVGWRYLDMSAASTANGGNAQLWVHTNSNAQVWKLEAVSGGYYRIVNANSGKVLDVKNANKANGTNVQQWQWQNHDAQLWKAYRSLYGGYVFINKATGKALDVSGGANADGANVQIWDANDTRAQSWHLESKQPYAQPGVANSTPMNAVEYATAREIFNAYNDYRRSKGLSMVVWSDECANMAFNSAQGNAAKGYGVRGKLVHKLGIPAAKQGNHSDILQYATWKMKGAEAVNRWSQSDGHRKMMQCPSAKKAAVGVYNNGGTWYYAIVYDFQGYNYGGY